MVAFREAFHVSIPMLAQAEADVISDPDIQRGAAFVRENVHPIVVIAHASRKNQRCFASLNMTKEFTAVILSEAKNLIFSLE